MFTTSTVNYVVYVNHTSSDCRTGFAEGSARLDTGFARLRAPARMLLTTIMTEPGESLVPVADGAAMDGNALSGKDGKGMLNSILAETDERFGGMLQRLAQ